MNKAIESSLTLALFLDAVKQREEDILKKSMEVQGFVEVLPSEFDVVHRIQMAGIHVIGVGNRRSIICRSINADSQSPKWFQTLIKEEAKNPTGFKIEVKVSGLAHSWRTAYVKPVAKTLKEATDRYKELCAEEARKPQTIADCKNIKEFQEFVMKYFTSTEGMVITRFDPNKAGCVAVYRDQPTKPYIIKGVEKIWDFTDGIGKGFTSLEEEITRNVTNTPA